MGGDWESGQQTVPYWVGTGNMGYHTIQGGIGNLQRAPIDAPTRVPVCVLVFQRSGLAVRVLVFVLGCVSVGVIIYVPDQCFGLCPAVQVQTENINPKINGVKPAENC